ncbi:MAG: hypothetical protein ACHQ03_11770, partial [Candidatus Bathyarchaeia archaeon]
MGTGRRHYPNKQSPRKAANNFFLGIRPKNEINSWDMPKPLPEASNSRTRDHRLVPEENELVDNDFGAKPNTNRRLTLVEKPAWEEFENFLNLYRLTGAKTYEDFVKKSIEPSVLLEAGFDPHNVRTEMRHVDRGGKEYDNDYYKFGTKTIGTFPNQLILEYGAVHWDKDPPEKFYLSVQEETKPHGG